MSAYNMNLKKKTYLYLPGGLVETIGTTPKYPEVRICSSMMSSRILLVQSSPSQLRHVALLSSDNGKPMFDFSFLTYNSNIFQNLHHQLKTQPSAHSISLPAMLPMLLSALIRLEFGTVFPSSTQLL